MSTGPKPEFQAWAMYLQSTLPQHELKIFSYDNDAKTHKIDIAKGRDADGVVAATIGVMELDQNPGSNAPMFTEVLMDSRGESPGIEKILCTIAFSMFKDRWKAVPGVVVKKVMAMWRPELEVMHVLLYPPIKWADSMDRVPVGAKTIHPLQAVPITDQENQLILSSGLGALEDLWTRTKCDVSDWYRRNAA